MAEEPQETKEEGGGEAQGPAKSKLSIKTLILIGLPLVLLQVAVAYFIVSKVIEPKLPETKPVPEDKKTEEAKAVSGDDLSDYVTYPLADVIVNPAETGGQRYLNVSIDIYVMLIYKDLFKDLEPEIRSVIIERISQKRMDELDDYKDQQILRGEIKDDLNAVIKKYFAKKFPDLEIPRVVFSKYIIQ